MSHSHQENSRREKNRYNSVSTVDRIKIRGVKSEISESPLPRKVKKRIRKKIRYNSMSTVDRIQNSGMSLNRKRRKTNDKKMKAQTTELEKTEIYVYTYS